MHDLKKVHHDGRHFMRHPTHIPIEVKQVTESSVNKEFLKDVSLGGLAFESDIPWEVGSIINIRVLIAPPIELAGKVVWCHEVKKDFEVGVEFIEKNNAIENEMVEEVCQIEMYQQMINSMIDEVLQSQYENIL
ncbi:MAG: PilZ domain-containing protein [Gammaproteobacteria bacterium]|nr:MAG: PilZ domain-containing protein [Gammaproteobacteria bacterium]RKZ41137.1 MAG: PilZ domain-containing protein [Gammaproteobacteria bacterium]RKZ74265.1 MAG: PilZ domain-containing protein [Gammaproteobacteria bacterium]